MSWDSPLPLKTLRCACSPRIAREGGALSGVAHPVRAPYARPMAGRETTLAVAAFLDSEPARALPQEAESIREVAHRIVATCFEDLAREP